MTSDDRGELEMAASELIAFYSAAPSVPFSERFNNLGSCGRAALPLAMTVFGAGTRMANNGKPRHGWKLGSVRAESHRGKAEMLATARCLINVDAVGAAFQAISVTNAAAEDAHPQPKSV
jgi:hypothetical protein